ncbi:MAG: hypothetical protein V4658_02295, partial [Bacteroidota bacterium]
MKTILLISGLLVYVLSFAQTDSVLYQKQPTANNVLAAKLQPIKGEKQYITAELIRIQGITRLSELLVWIDKTTYTTIDWNKHALNINGTSTMQQQNYLLMINGMKVELERWDAIGINELGIAVTDIAYVEISTVPQVINGLFAGKGAINIVMRNDYKGLTVSGYNNYGNPVSDPGPLQYTNKYSSPNIHKTGLVYAYSAGYYAKKWHININQNYSDWYLRSQSIIRRLGAFDPTIEMNTLRSTRLEGAVQLGKFLIEAGGAASGQKGYVYRNYLQTEIPAGSYYSEGRLRITRVLKNNQYVKGNFILNSHRFDQVSNLFPDYKYLTSTTNIEYGKTYYWKKDRFIKHASGYAVNYASYTNGKTYQLQHKPYSTLSYNLSKKIKQQLDVALAVFENTVNPSIAFKHEKSSSIINSSSVIVSYQQNRVNEQYNQFWQFYSTNQTLKPLAYPKTINSTPTHFFTADYFYYISSSSSFKLTLNPGIRYQHNYHFIQPDGVAAYPLVSANSSARTAGFYTITFGANLHYDVFNNFWFDIDYFSANDKSGNKDLQQVLNSDARRKIMASIYFKLPARIDIGLRSQAVSKTQWNYFDAAGNLVNQN